MSVYSAQYASTEVLELFVNNVAVMRRVSDDALNATQLLKLAGLDKPKRARALDQIQGEKIQGGYGKFQGTWVSAQFGLELARQYNIYQLVAPLIEYDLRKKPPSKEAINSNPAPMRPLDPVPITHPAYENSRHLITDTFFSGDGPDPSTLQQRLSGVEMDVPIDDSGHTALHWASSLGSIDLVKTLIGFGAHPTRGNYSGETPLARSVLVTNNSDFNIFEELLEALASSLFIRDSSGRSVLHHIVLTAGIPGRSEASKYYMETLLQWVVKKNSLQTFSSLINSQDQNGDTPLNIAARLGNRNLYRQLIEVGGDAMISNRAGLRPVDFFPSDEQQGHPPGSEASAVMHRPASAPTGSQRISSSAPAKKRQELHDQMKEMLRTLEVDFNRELEQRDRILQQSHQQLRQDNEKLEDHRKLVAAYNLSTSQWTNIERTVSSLQAAIRQEDEKFCAEEREQGRTPVGLDADIDADHPFSVYDIPDAALRARIAAYRINNQRLESLKDGLMRRSNDLENKFRHIISLCTDVHVSEVEGLLDGLIDAVESDPHSVDLTRISSFMRRVRH